MPQQFKNYQILIVNMNVKPYKGVDIATSIFGMYLVDSIAPSDNIHVLTADMAVASCLERIKLQFPDRYTDVGIAEQNMIGVAAGLASEGFHPIAICQACFISMRAFEMNRQLLGYMKSNVVLVGLHAGFFLQFMGYSHYAVEDFAIMKTIPNMVVLSPADSGEAVSCMQTALNHNGPVYIRLTGGSMAEPVYHECCETKIGGSHILKDGDDITIFATGAVLGQAIKAADLLESNHDLRVKVVDMYSLKPLDEIVISDSKNSQLFVTIEEHGVVGGLGSSISDYISCEGGYPALLKLGVRDDFNKVGDYKYLLEENRLTPELLAEDILKKYINIKSK